MHRPAPSVPAYWRENFGRCHRSRPKIRAESLDGAGLRLYHSEEGTHPPERVFPLLNGGKFHPEESHAVRSYDEESEFPSRPGQGVFT